MDDLPNGSYSFLEPEGISFRNYRQAFDLVKSCGEEHTPRSFCIRLLELLKQVCPYDMAALIFLDANNKLSGIHTTGRKRMELKKHIQYYIQDYIQNYISNIAGANTPFNLFCGKREASGFSFSGVFDWKTFSEDEFKRRHITPLGLCHSMGFCFFDLSGTYRVVFILDRVRDTPFSEEEKNCLGLALPVLNNIYRNFFYSGIDDEKGQHQTPWKQYNLTPREEEVLALLCQGMTTQNISSALYISVGTTYKHVANILSKTGVSSKQELLVKLMGRKD